MKKLSKNIFSILIVLSMFFTMILATGCANHQEEPYTVVAFGDSISAGYAPAGTSMFEDYQKYASKKVDISASCYTNLIAGQISASLKAESDIDIKNVKAKSYAESGDKTSDLIAKINNKTKYPKLENDVKNANLITLCIGANNLLAPISNKFSDYMTSSVTRDEIVALLNEGYESFQRDYKNIIMPYFTKYSVPIFVMTIYNPFKYFDISEVQVSESLIEKYPKISDFIDDVPKIIELAEEYIEKINDYIRKQEYENVVVVDVYQSFNSLEASEFKTYINVDSSKLKINAITDIFLLQSNIYIDPHPTKAGQIYISQLFLNEIVANYTKGDTTDANKDI